MSIEYLEKHISRIENEKIDIIDTNIIIYPNPTVKGCFNGTIAVTNKRILGFSNIEKGLINKTFRGYKNLEYEIEYDNITHIESINDDKLIFKIWNKLKDENMNDHLFRFQVRNSENYPLLFDAISKHYQITTTNEYESSDNIDEKIQKDSFFDCIDIINNPDEIAASPFKYLLIKDSAKLNKFRNLMYAVNILAERGWECISLSSTMNVLASSTTSHQCYALMKKIT